MDPILAIAGFLIGGLVGMTGVGGGSLMTPFLLFYGIPPAVAVGTDLAYAAIAKSLGVWLRHKASSIDWRTAGLLMMGSLPASVAVIAALDWLAVPGETFEFVITRVLGVALILTALTIVGHRWLQSARACMPELRGRSGVTIAAGGVLGALVTITSVGSGALGTAMLLLLYPRWSVATVVGTDLAYAVPLTAAAALGHVYLGHVDLGYTLSLALGALPGMYLGTSIGLNVREDVVRGVLSLLFVGIGLNFLVR